jgi:sodium transport system permease protein
MSDIWRIYRKDGLEVLRDRRTLFVNLILPLLLYPVIMLFMVQVLQLNQATPGEPARVAVVNPPGALMRLLRDETPLKPTRSARPMSSALAGPKPAPLVLVEIPPADAARLGALVAAAASDPLDHSPEALAILRRNQLVAAVVHRELPEGRHSLAVLQDDASPRSDELQPKLAAALDAWRRELIQERLAAAGLPANTIAPLESASVALAPPAESVRTRVAGIIPLLLVLLAASGAFYPALDLIAGERERGTLETLLSLPVRRRDVFLGKLLVACTAALVGVVLNLLSLVVSVALIGSQLSAQANSGVDIAGMFTVGGGVLLLCVVVLLPLTVTLAALALALTGLAHTAKEAQNYLSPLLLVVLLAAAVAALPGTHPNMALDLVPITGAVLALKEALQSAHPPWHHLALATAASLALATVVVSWSARLLDTEHFRYPGLVRAGWGRFRRWGTGPATPGGLEALAVYAIAVAGMTQGAGFFAGANAATMVAGPLLLFVALPTLVHLWFGGYRPAELGLRLPDARGWLAGLLLIPLALVLSAGLGAAQQAVIPKAVLEQGGEQMQQVIHGIREQGGTALLLACVALLPGFCEELLCRGTLLSGLRRGIGPVGATLVSAFLFAALHMSPWRFAPQFMLGILLAIVVWRTRSLLPAMLIHAGHNGALVLIELYLGKDVPPQAIGGLVLLALFGASSAWLLTRRHDPATHTA